MAEQNRLMQFASSVIPGFGALGSIFAPPKEPSKKQLQNPEALVDPSRLVAGWNLQPYNPSWLVTRKGLAIYDQMKRDEQVKAALKFKKSSVLAAGWEVVSPPEEAEDWEVTLFVRDALTRIQGGWNATLYNVLSGLEYGFSIGEKVYKEVEVGEWTGKLQLDRIQSLKPHYLDFIVDEFGQLQGIRQQMLHAAGSGPERLLAPAKFVYYTHEFEFGNFYGSSDLEAAYRPWWVKDNAYKWLAVTLERYGMPPLFAMYDPQAYQGAQIEELKKVVRNIQNATFGVLPRSHGDALEFWSQELGGQSSSIFLSALQRFDEHIARALLVPSMLGVSSDEGKTGSLARSQEHAASFLRIIEQIQQNISTMVVNAQIIPQLCDLNWGELGSYPQFRFLPFSDEKRLEVMATWSELVTGKIVGRVEDDEVHIRKVMGFPENESVKLEPLPGDAALDVKKELGKKGLDANGNPAFGGKGDGKNPFGKKAPKEVPAQDQTAEMQQFAEENNAVWLETEDGAVAVDAFAWDESKHPRHARGTIRGGKFASTLGKVADVVESAVGKTLEVSGNGAAFVGSIGQNLKSHFDFSASLKRAGFTEIPGSALLPTTYRHGHHRDVEVALWDSGRVAIYAPKEYSVQEYAG